MLKIEIDVFKASGKWYASGQGDSVEDIPLFKDAYKEFVRRSLPADIGEGYVITRDSSDGDGFHIRLYTYEELFGK